MTRTMQLVLMTTSDTMSGRGADLARLCGSVAESLPTSLAVRHIVLLQRCTEAQRSALESELRYPAIVLASAARMPLSVARNVMLARARADGLLTAETIVGFPDDDCWYTPTFAHRLLDVFQDQTDLGLLITRVSLSPSSDWNPGANRAAKACDVLRRSSSNGIFVRGSVADEVGDFDVRLGLGTSNTSGEDTDYAIRASAVARRALYVDLPLVGHREPDLASVTKYFGGNMIVAARYALRSPAFFSEYARKYLVGAYLVLKRHLELGRFATAIQGSLRMFGKSAG